MVFRFNFTTLFAKNMFFENFGKMLIPKMLNLLAIKSGLRKFWSK